MHAQFDDRITPIASAALGAYSLVARNHSTAIEQLERAIAERERWPAVTRECFWTEDARDLYLLAVAHHRLAASEGTGSPHAAAARERFAQAEAAGRGRSVPYEYADLFERIRTLAREELGSGR
jgi:hypothetical protein